MPESSRLRKGFWSLPQDRFVQGLSNPQMRALQLQGIKFKRWLFLGFILVSFGLMLFFSSWPVERDNLWHIFTLIFLFWMEEKLSCKQYIIEVVDLLDRERAAMEK